MLTENSLPRHPSPEIAARERAVFGLLRFVSEFGNVAERFFERIYRGLSRKRTGMGTHPPDPDQLTALRQANRELATRVREVQTVAARMESVFARIDEGVIMQSPEGRVVLMNEAALKLIGGMKSFWESELGQMFKQAREQFHMGSELEPIGDPIRIQANDIILGVKLAAVFTPDGFPLGSLMVLRDVTREALADRLRDQFVTQITHELRTPLTSILGMSDVLINQPADRPPNRKFLEAIARNAAILDKMINDLLDLSELTGGTLAVRQEPLALDELVLDIIKGREPQIKKAALNVGVMVTSRANLTITGDARRLAWAIGHLLDNAINYTLKGGFITVRLGQIRGNNLLVEVIDNGVGISERDMVHIFERFYRGQAYTSDGKTVDPRGLGQGLFIARAVAEAHKGYLVATSTLGKGSRFTLGLPR